MLLPACLQGLDNSWNFFFLLAYKESQGWALALQDVKQKLPRFLNSRTASWQSQGPRPVWPGAKWPSSCINCSARKILNCSRAAAEITGTISSQTVIEVSCYKQDRAGQWKWTGNMVWLESHLCDPPPKGCNCRSIRSVLTTLSLCFNGPTTLC